MKTKLLLVGAGLAMLVLVEVGYSVALQRYSVDSPDESLFRGPFSSLLRAAR